MPGPIVESVEIKTAKNGLTYLTVEFAEGATQQEKEAAIKAIPYMFDQTVKNSNSISETFLGSVLDRNIGTVADEQNPGTFILDLKGAELSKQEKLDVTYVIENLNPDTLQEYNLFADYIAKQKINEEQLAFEATLPKEDISVSDDVVAEPVVEAKVASVVAAKPVVDGAVAEAKVEPSSAQIINISGNKNVRIEEIDMNENSISISGLSLGEVKIEPVKTKPEASSEVTIAAKQAEQLNINSFASIISEPSLKAPERTVPDIANAALKGVLSQQADLLSALKTVEQKTKPKEEPVLAANTSAVEEPKTGAKAPGKLVSSNSNAFSFKKPAAEQPALETEVLAAVAPVAEEVKVAALTNTVPAPVVEEAKVTKEQITAIDTLNNYINSGKVLGYKAGYNGNAEEVAAVKELQTALVALGYDIGKTGVDGKYGDKTKAAVVEFQTSQALYADGIYGEKSNGKLNAVFAAVEQTKAVDIVYDAAKAGVSNVAVGTVADKGTGLTQK
jgi:hypothetical protein